MHDRILEIIPLALDFRAQVIRLQTIIMEDTMAFEFSELARIG